MTCRIAFQGWNTGMSRRHTAEVRSADISCASRLDTQTV